MTKQQGLPLAGIRVLDLTTTFFGPYATQILADFGADVIKIEAPHGDTMRGVGPSRSEGMGVMFMTVNRNKRSIVLDLKTGPGCEALWRLIEGADAFVHNIRPQKMAALGFDPDAVLARNPKIVYGGLHGYWEQGPYGGRPAYDDVVQGECGLAGLFAERDGTPDLVPSAMVDKTAAIIAGNALIAAIAQRQATGKGSYVEVGMFEAMAAFNLLEHQYGASFVPPIGEAGYPRSLSSERKPFATSDGYICMLAYTDQQWRRFWALAGRPGLADDDRFTTIGARTRNIDVLYAQAAEVLKGNGSAQWLELLREAEIPCGPVNGFAEVLADPHLRETGFFRQYEHPTEGQMEIPDTGYRFDGQSLPLRHHAPGLGEHNEEILREAGYSDEEMATMGLSRQDS